MDWEGTGKKRILNCPVHSPFLDSEMPKPLSLDLVARGELDLIIEASNVMDSVLTYRHDVRIRLAVDHLADVSGEPVRPPRDVMGRSEGSHATHASDRSGDGIHGFT